MLDIHELGRRAGAMQERTFTSPAPENLGVAVARVPEGSDLHVDVRLESVIEGVLVTGTADIEVEAECSRCLEPMSWNEDVEFVELYRYPPTDARGALVADERDRDEDAGPELQGDDLDLEPTIRDAVVLALPLAPVCTDECAGLCPECGIRLADEPGHQHDTTDPRWDALATLLETPATEERGRPDGRS